MIRLVTRPRPQNESPARGGAEAGLEGMIVIRAKGCNSDDRRLAYLRDTGVTWTELRTARRHYYFYYKPRAARFVLVLDPSTIK